MPWTKPPSICPISTAGLSERPTSWKMSVRGLRVPVDFWRAIEAGGRERDAREIGLLDQLGERHRTIANEHAVVAELDLVRLGLVFLRRKRNQPRLDRAGRILCRHAVDVGPGRRSGRRGVRHLGSRGRGYLYLLGVNAELLGHHLRDLDVEP